MHPSILHTPHAVAWTEGTARKRETFPGMAAAHERARALAEDGYHATVYGSPGSAISPTHYQPKEA